MSADASLVDEDSEADRLNRLEALTEMLRTRVDTLEGKVEEEQAARQAAEDERDELQERVSVLESAVVPDPATKAYEEKDREDLVRELKIALVRQAQKNGNVGARKNYREVRSLWNDKPSPGHVYTVMRQAAGYDKETGESTVDGFTFGTDANDNYAISVTLADVNDESLFHAANNESGWEGGR